MAADRLRERYGVDAEVWSVTSFSELARDGREAERARVLGLEATNGEDWVRHCLGASDAPVIAATDYVRAVPEQIRAWVPAPYRTLGTDGFGRSDFRSKLREHFEVNRHYIVVAALKALAEDGALPAAKVAEAIKKYGINADKVNPLYA